MATEIEKSTYKWVKKHDAIKLIFFLGISAICFSFFIPYGLVFFFAGLLTLLFCSDYKKWNRKKKKREEEKKYVNRNKEIQRIISKYKSINNIPPQIKIRLDELKEENLIFLRKETPNSLYPLDYWYREAEMDASVCCKVCGSENIGLEGHDNNDNIPVNHWIIGALSFFKDDPHYSPYRNITFCYDCGYLKMSPIKFYIDGEWVDY